MEFQPNTTIYFLSMMHVATCFDSKQSSSVYYMNHNIDIYQMHIWDPKSLHAIRRVIKHCSDVLSNVFKTD
jgi:hypothetical protein